MHFSRSTLLHYFNLHTQVNNVLAKCQLHILRDFQVTVLQIGSSKKIDLYSKYRENKLQVLAKTYVTYDVDSKFALLCSP